MTAGLFMRGLRDPGDLAMVERWMPEVVRWSESRSAERLGRPSRTLTERREPAMSASDIRRLAEGEALLFVRGLAPVDVRLRGPWELDRRQRAVHAHAERRYDSALAARRGR